MTILEPRISSVRINHTTNCATTTAQFTETLCFYIGPIASHFLFYFVFPIQLTLNRSYKITNDCIRTADLWCWKRPLYQLRHNHCPISRKLLLIKKFL